MTVTKSNNHNVEKIFFALPGNEALTNALAKKCGAEVGDASIRRFPDGETYVKINSDVKNKKIIAVCTFNHPDDKILPLYFLTKTAKNLGAKYIHLVAPYLAYMRQDKRFQEGESITSEYFAGLISFFVDELTTIDPHLHRIASLSEIYSIPTKVLHASGLISQWIKNNIKKAVLVGPDSESEQWVAEAAKEAATPYIVLQKKRKGDREVEVSVPDVKKFTDHTPVLIDDIISTARTMIETVGHLRRAGMKPPTCVGVHGIFAGNAYQDLVNAGTGKIITCNTIAHESNGIDITELLTNNI